MTTSSLTKVILAHGRKIPTELQIKPTERSAIAEITQEKDPKYYNNHLKPYFLQEGTHFDPTNLRKYRC